MSAFCTEKNRTFAFGRDTARQNLAACSLYIFSTARGAVRFFLGLHPNAKVLKKCRAFTLVEMLVTVSIIAIFSTITVMNLNFQRTDRVIEKVTGELYSSLLYARNLSVSGKIFKNGIVPNGYGVYLNNSDYKMFADANTGPLPHPRVYDAPDEDTGVAYTITSETPALLIEAVNQDGTAVGLPMDIFFEVPNGEIYFMDPISGNVYSYASIEIRVEKYGFVSQRKSIYLNKRTGQMYVIPNP